MGQEQSSDAPSSRPHRPIPVITAADIPPSASSTPTSALPKKETTKEYKPPIPILEHVDFPRTVRAVQQSDITEKTASTKLSTAIGRVSSSRRAESIEPVVSEEKARSAEQIVAEEQRKAVDLTTFREKAQSDAPAPPNEIVALDKKLEPRGKDTPNEQERYKKTTLPNGQDDLEESPASGEQQSPIGPTASIETDASISHTVESEQPQFPDVAGSTETESVVSRSRNSVDMPLRPALPSSKPKPYVAESVSEDVVLDLNEESVEEVVEGVIEDVVYGAVKGTHSGFRNNVMFYFWLGVGLGVLIGPLAFVALFFWTELRESKERRNLWTGGVLAAVVAWIVVGLAIGLTA